jgi:hypothetical protein
MKLILMTLMLLFVLAVGTENLFFPERVRARDLRRFEASPEAGNVKIRDYLMSRRPLFHSYMIGVICYLMAAVLVYVFWTGQWR